ncbi:E3 ubiquitin-protein ligase SGR9, amyloplastic-like [Telopea speciosissima]|uniref:E3 ubiquitin-protein ligase SGR9, amyloplastic-like n=1 Tax=Telopea speciosissima TaxID=54955 RepID=UPI001CC7C4C8|nr:E3 ubiquitin-protein ligase SGR9, amyloplastic-like [Telopea speciosissima]
MDEKEKKIMVAISTLNTNQFSHLIHSVSSEFWRQQNHLFSLLQSPTRFPLTLHHLQTLTLHQKTLLIARYLLSMLTHLTRFLETNTPNTSTALRLKDLDAALLLMLLCQVHQQEPQALQRLSPAQWRSVLMDYQLGISLSTLGGLGGSSSAVLTPFIDIATRCRTFLEAAGCGDEMEREVAASVAAVVALPSVELSGGGGEECAICKEEMKEGREVCELPCDHLFHWMCVLPWLKKKNTCPCCRFQLPTDDVFGEIQRLWGVIVTKSRMDSCG